MITLCI